MPTPWVTNPKPSTVVAPIVAVEVAAEQLNVGGAPIPPSLKLNTSQAGQCDFLSEPFPV